MSGLTPGTSEFEKRVLTSFGQQSFMTLIGAKISHVAAGEVDIDLPFRPDLVQQHGYFHAGCTSAIADSAGGYAAFSLFKPGFGVLTTEFKINLIAPGKGDRLVARGRVIKPGRTLTICKSDVVAIERESETLIATALLTMMQIEGLED